MSHEGKRKSTRIVKRNGTMRAVTKEKKEMTRVKKTQMASSK